jgi:hypothetical protein
MRRAAEYRKRAEECRNLAELTSKPEDKRASPLQVAADEVIE